MPARDRPASDCGTAGCRHQVHRGCVLQAEPGTARRGRQRPGDTAGGGRDGTAPHLTAAQRDAVTRYTGDAFYKLNRALRAGDDSDPEIRRLDAAMRPVPGDMILARHVDMSPENARALAGKRISDPAYSSAVLGSPHAGGLGGVTLHIAVPKGTPAINAAA